MSQEQGGYTCVHKEGRQGFSGLSALETKKSVTRISGSYKKLLSPLCFKMMLSVISMV